MRRPVSVTLAVTSLLTLMMVTTAHGGTDGASPAASDVPLRAMDRVEAAIAVPGSPDWPIAAFGSIWVLAPDLPMRQGTGTPGLVRIDPATNEVIATIELPDRLCQGMVASADAIWVCAADALVRVDPDTDSIDATVPIKGAMAFYRMAFGAGLVWALGSESFVGDSVIALDPAAHTTTTYPAGGPVGGLTYAFDALWLTIPGTGSVVRLDPATGETHELVTGLSSPTHITAGPDSLWVTLHGGDEDEARPGDSQVVRIDPDSGEIIAQLAIGGSPRGSVSMTRFVAGSMRDSHGRVLRTQTVGAEPEINAIQGALTEGFGSIWTVNIEEDTVYRLLP